METLWVETASKKYPVHIGKGAAAGLAPFLQEQSISKILIITDEKVATLHLEAVKDILRGSGKPVLDYIVPEGESAKTFDVYYECQSFCLSQSLNRKSAIVALGGGAVGDLAGFVAATFMRGIPFIQVPTTLLAHDSAVGGKVAVNHPLGKNMIGAFHQPEAVFYDLSFLNTLPVREIRSGFAEVIKHSLISDPAFYLWLKQEITDLASISEEQYFTMIKKGIQIKSNIVKHDEKESGIRAYLNFGHTLGHAIEAAMGYGNFTHGEAVLIGMIYALSLSCKEEEFQFDSQEFTRWAEKLGYSTKIPAGLSHKDLLGKMKSDKKSTGDQVTFVLLKEVGAPLLSDIPDVTLLEEMDSCLFHSEEAER
ncbi:3-dehydroquinate synthase [Bacillus massiliglaciei]|uniref:3-dehydroquinate synthase n=1 Tax=Bacillus massiliglaciei TaxID=1816693 RepID=UPI000AAC8B28|nr:3-dehydroquinate synthase [Bacillus massiliglaciei]